MLGAIASIAMASAGNMMTVVNAVKFGSPNNSDQAQENVFERHDKKVEKFLDARFDDNPKNDNGPDIAHENMHDLHGLDCC